MTSDLAFLSWALVMIALCGLLTFSFIKNLRVIRDASQQLAAPLAGGTDAEALERYRGAILRVEAQNRSWLLPRLGLGESVEVERGLKERFCRRFQKAVLAPLDQETERNVALLNAYSSDGAYCQYAMHLVRRLNILRARLGGADAGELQKRPLPAAPIPPKDLTDRSLQEPARRFGQLYLCYLAWSGDEAALRTEARQVQARLKEVLVPREGNLRWLCHWVEHNEGLAPLTLSPFWGGIASGEPELMLYPTYTRKGMERLNALVAELEAATGNRGGFRRAKAELDGWQRNAAFSAWHSFALDFSGGVKRLRGNHEWQRVAAVMATDRGPYLAFMDRMAYELEPLSRGGDVPSWVRQLYLLQGGRTQRAAPYQGIMAKAAGSGVRALGGMRQKLSGGGAATADPLQETAAGWREYLAALGSIAPAVASRAQSFQLASQTFSDDPATGRSPFFAAYHAMNRIQLGVGSDTPMTEVCARLVAGPMNFFWYYVRQEAAAQLQEQWEEQVVPGAAELPGAQATQVLLGPDGLAWKFAKGPAAPFLVRTEHGYRPKEVLGATLPLDSAFFSFMARGPRVVASTLTRQASYTVGVRGYPTEANGDATTQPHATRLELLCTGNTQSLVNLNYPTGKTFYWAPDSCSDVVLQVEVGDLVLTKRYGGPHGFPSFLEDFRGGSRTFASSEFPGEAGALTRMGIRQVKVNYRFTGNGAVIKQTAGARAQVPRNIGKSY